MSREADSPARVAPPTPPCPTCGKPLEEVRYPGGYLNEDQWDSIRAGDWWCETCPSNGRGRSGAYFWKNEIAPTVASPPRAPSEPQPEPSDYELLSVLSDALPRSTTQPNVAEGFKALDELFMRDQKRRASPRAPGSGAEPLSEERKAELRRKIALPDLRRISGIPSPDEVLAMLDEIERLRASLATEDAKYDALWAMHKETQAELASARSELDEARRREEHHRTDDPHCGTDEVAGYGFYHAEMLSDEALFLQLGPDVFTVYFDKKQPCLNEGRTHRKGVLHLRFEESRAARSSSHPQDPQGDGTQ